MTGLRLAGDFSTASFGAESFFVGHGSFFEAQFGRFGVDEGKFFAIGFSDVAESSFVDFLLIWVKRKISVVSAHHHSNVR